MPLPLDIVAIAGSLRKASYNKGLLRAAKELAPSDVSVEILDLAALPLYNQDLEKVGLPAAAANLRSRVGRADALLIATPEYNHTIPGVMGNAIDWLSRRPPTSPLRGKCVAIMGAARGGGSVRAQAALRVPLTHARALVLDGPVIALYDVDQLASDAGDLVDPAAREDVGKLMEALATAVRRARS
jgi:chromate reductase, NAD(P)H dehydrogenase (quinone)